MELIGWITTILVAAAAAGFFAMLAAIGWLILFGSKQANKRTSEQANKRTK
jgi:hypothetical protein